MPAAARGRAAGKSDKLWKDAIRRAVLRREDGQQKLERLADQLVSQGLAGDVSALREIGDRLDGKATQPVESDVNLTMSVDAATLAAIHKRSNAA